MRKYLIVAIIFLSACQKEPTPGIAPIDVKGEVLFISRRNTNSAEWQMFLMNTDGSNQRLVTNKIVTCSPVFLSNKGTKIAFTTYENLSYNLYSIDTDGQNLKFLSKGKEFCGSPVWSADDSRITFVKNDNPVGGNSDIYSIQADGNNETKLTSQDNNFSPKYLPDNSAIIYTSSNGTISGVYRMNIDGSNKQLLTPQGKSLTVSSISPNGKLIALNSVDWNGTQIFIMNVNGTGLKQITFTVEINYWDIGFPRGGNLNPVWSPNSIKLAYVSFEHSTPDIFTINANGSENKRLTGNPLRDESPHWTKDGNYILFTSGKKWDSGGVNYTGSGISIMRANGQSNSAISDFKTGDSFPSYISK